MPWETLAPAFRAAAETETHDPAAAVLVSDHLGLVALSEASCSRLHADLHERAVPVEASRYRALQTYCDTFLTEGRGDLATAMMLRWARDTTVAVVTPQNWQEKSSYKQLREWILGSRTYSLFARIGNNVWQTQSGGQPFKVPTVLSVVEHCRPTATTLTSIIDIGNGRLSAKAHDLQQASVTCSLQSAQRDNPESRILVVPVPPSAVLLGEIARCLQGTSTGDTPRYVRLFSELPRVQLPWQRFQSSTSETAFYIGREFIVRWESPGGVVDEPGSAIRGDEGWGHVGVSVTQMGNLNRTLFLGDKFDTNAAAVVPLDPSLVPALWAFCTSQQFVATVRSVASSTQVTNGALEVVPFDIDHWREVVKHAGPLPKPQSDDPTQWLFGGRPETSTAPLQVAVARLVGYRWPEQSNPDDLDQYSDVDGIVCLPSVAGEAPAADRVQLLLAAAFDEAWSPAKLKGLLEQAGSKKKNLADWLRDEFFKQHCALFGSRPFVWHIWDGQRDGFSALVNYHRLDRKDAGEADLHVPGSGLGRAPACGGPRRRGRCGGAGCQQHWGCSRSSRRSSRVRRPLDIYVRWKEILRAAHRLGARPQ